MPETTINHIWSIADLERNVSDGKVNTVHYVIDSSDGTHSGYAYGSVGLEGEATVPFEELSEDEVISWAKAALGAEEVERIEAGLAQQIAVKYAPKTASGVPWQPEAA